jgi:CubicO group peptidase (beta-lactamase class C family)
MSDLRTTADALLSGAVASGSVAGAAAIVVNHAGALYEGAAGARALGGGEPMDIDSVCWIASMTKPLVSVAAVQLIERGAIDLDAPARDVLPAIGEIGVFTGYAGDGAPQVRPPKRPITLRHLLTHTSGFGYELFSDDVVKLQSVLGLPGLGDAKLSALSVPLLFDPGERWEYGVSTDWAGRLVETVSGKTLGAYLKDNILDPLGMTSTAFALTPALRARLTGMHVRTPDGAIAPFPFETHPAPEFESGGGGLYSTARDYAHFVRMMLNGGALEGARIVGPDGMTLLSTNQMGAVRVTPLKTATPLSNDAEIFPGVEKTWSLAFQINEASAPTGRAAGGLMWAGLSNCYFWIDPKSRVGGVVFAQLLPFADPRAMQVWSDFETAVYANAKGQA